MTKTSHLLKIERLAQDLIRQHLPTEHGWKFAWGKGKRSVGFCDWASREIRLSRFFAEVNTIERMRETILHEIAHACAGPRAGHGAAWKAECVRLGCPPERLANPEDIVAVPGAWTIECPRCGVLGQRHRPIKIEQYRCRHCRSRLDIYRTVQR